MRKKRKILGLGLGLATWSGWFYLVFKIPPSSTTYYPFFLILFLALFLTFSLFLKRGRALIFSLVLVIFLILRLLKMTHPLNLILLLAIIIVSELYSRHGKKR